MFFFSYLQSSTITYFMNSDTLYELRHLCRDYRLKVSSTSDSRGRLLGVRGFISLVGDKLAVKLYKRAQSAKNDKITCKLRRGLVFTFYVK